MTTATAEKPKTRRPIKRTATTTAAEPKTDNSAKVTRPKAQPAKPEPKLVQPEIDLSDYRTKEPSALNKAEALWLLEGVGMLEDMAPEEIALAQKITQLVAGPCHRAWQNSVANKKLHGKA